MIRVLVADDHAVVRRGVVQILDEAPDMVAAGEASTGRQVLNEIQEHDFDVLVLDIAMPEGSGLEVLNQLQTLKPNLRVLILSMYPEKQYAVRALKAGAAGYLTKESAPGELLTAIRRVAQGGKYISQSLAEELAAGLVGEAEMPPSERLSDREYQVVRLLAQGKTVTEIATELALSIKTISTYRARVLEKLNLRNTAEIIRYAFEHGIAE
jgi:two-component system invasion response regulator UvrY